MPKITDKQWLFIKHYAKTMMVEESATAAGYKGRSEAKRLMKKPHILKAINRELEANSIFVGPTVPRIIQELMRIAFFDPAKLFTDNGDPKPLSEIDEDTRRCICGIEFALEGRGEDVVTIKKYKVVDKHKALENLGRHLAMFTDKLKIDVPTELDNMDDRQLRDTVRQLAKATGLDLGASEAPETKH